MDSTSHNTNTEQTLVNMAIESWRFSKVFNRLLNKVDAGEQGRFLGQKRWFLENLKTLYRNQD